MPYLLHTNLEAPQWLTVISCFMKKRGLYPSPRGSLLVSLLCPALGLAGLCLYPAGILLWGSLEDGERLGNLDEP